MVSDGAAETDPELMTVAQVAQELHVSAGAVRDWIRKKKLPAIQPGERQYLVRRADFERLKAFPEIARQAPSTDRTPAEKRHEQALDLEAHLRTPR